VIKISDAIFPNIEELINYNKNVGPLQALSAGYPGSGKSNQATNIVTECLKDRPGYKGEMAIMHGDIACEWRHFLRYSKYVKKIILVYPLEIKRPVDLVETFNINLKKYKVPVEEKYIDLQNEDWNIVTSEFMEPNCLTVLYDDCFVDTDRTVIWGAIGRQLAYRTEFVNNTITYLCHEAHEIFPQTASGDQWNAIQDFISAFSLWRKRRIRAILICHQESEVYERLRKKCYWKIYRDSFPSHWFMRQVIMKNILKTTIATYHLFKGMRYRANNTSEKMKEIKGNWLMIPRILINLYGGPVVATATNSGRKLPPLECESCKHIWQPRVSQPQRCPKCNKRLQYSTETDDMEEENYGSTS
jgi:hypothetical protein